MTAVRTSVHFENATREAARSIDAVAQLLEARNRAFVAYDQAAKLAADAFELDGPKSSRSIAAKEFMTETRNVFLIVERLWRASLDPVEAKAPVAEPRFTTSEAVDGETWSLVEMLAANDSEDVCGWLCSSVVGDVHESIVTITRVA